MKVIGNGFIRENSVMNVASATDSRAILEELRETLRLLEADLPAIASRAEDSGRTTTVSLLAARMIETSSAMFLVASHGMNNETQSLLRVLLDAYFLFACVIKEERFHEEYFRSDEATRLKLVNVLVGQTGEFFDEAREWAIREKHSLIEIVVEGKAREFKSEELAKRAGCDFFYQTLYRVASASVHSSPRSLMLYTTSDSEGNIECIEIGKNDFDSNPIAVAIEVLTRVRDAANSIN